MSFEKIDEKIAENVRKIAELELKKQKLREAGKERELLYKKQAEAKRQADIDHEAYLKEQQRLRDQKEYEKSDIARMERAKQEGIEKVEQDIAMGLTESEVEYKYMDAKTRRECDNAIAQREAKDVRDFLKRKRLEQEASERRRRRLKGL